MSPEFHRKGYYNIIKHRQLLSSHVVVVVVGAPEMCDTSTTNSQVKGLVFIIHNLFIVNWHNMSYKDIILILFLKNKTIYANLMLLRVNAHSIKFFLQFSWKAVSSLHQNHSQSSLHDKFMKIKPSLNQVFTLKFTKISLICSFCPSYNFRASKKKKFFFLIIFFL